MRNLGLIAALFIALPLAAQDPTPPAQGQKPAKPVLERPDEAPADVPAATAAPKKPAPVKKPAISETEGKVVEEIVARVNNEVITRSEYEHSKITSAEDAKTDCQNRCTPEQLNARIEDLQKNALRDLIDQSLLVQRAKDMGVSVEPDVIKQLDQIRIENKLPSMEALEQAVSSQPGMNWEDFKNNIRNGLLTKKVIGSEVGSHINVPKDEIQKYYDEHKAEFMRPEQVALRSIEVNTAGKDETEVAELKKKADTALKRIQDGEDFGEIAKRYSDGSTAKQGGYLGIYKRGELSKELEDTVFKLQKNGLTPVMETKQGFLIMQVLEHYDEGEQSLAKVASEIEGKLYNQRLEPALRDEQGNWTGDYVRLRFIARA